VSYGILNTNNVQTTITTTSYIDNIGYILHDINRRIYLTSIFMIFIYGNQSVIFFKNSSLQVEAIPELIF